MDFKLVSDYQPQGDQPQAIEQMVRGLRDGSEHQILLGVTGSGKSLPPDEQVFVGIDREGQIEPSLVPIGELVDGAMRSAVPFRTADDNEIVFGEQVPARYYAYAFDPVTMQSGWQPITSFTRHPSPPSLFRLRTSCGRRVTVTGDHNVWVMRDGTLQLLLTADLRVGDCLPLPSSLPAPSQPLQSVSIADPLVGQPVYVQVTPEIASSLSLPQTKRWHVIHNNERVRLELLPQEVIAGSQLGSLRNPQILPATLRLTDEWLCLLGTYVAEGHATGRYVLLSVREAEWRERILQTLSHANLRYGIRANGDIQISARLPAHVLTQWCGRTAWHKHLPPFWLHLSDPQLGRLLSGYFAGDGCVEAEGVSCATVSRRLADELIWALTRLGIWARIRYRRLRKPSGEPTSCWSISITGRENVELFACRVGFDNNRKQQRLESLLRRLRGRLANTNVDIVPVSGDVMKGLRRALDWTQKEMAEAMGICRPLISMIESNRRRPSRQAWQRLMTALKDSIEENHPVAPQVQQLGALLNCRWTPLAHIEEVAPTSPYVYDLSVASWETFVAGFGGVFVHNTFSIAKVIETVNRTTLVMAHNKTLAAQLYQEFKSFFPHNAVEYFVSYYDYYQPEAYVPSTDTFIEKEATINEEIDRLRLSATRSLFERRDCIVVASVSCIYGLGDPDAYYGMVIFVERGQQLSRTDLLKRLVELQYQRNDIEFTRGAFRVRGDVVEIYPVYQDRAIRVEFWGDEIDSITTVDPLLGEVLDTHDRLPIYPKTHYVTSPKTIKQAIKSIKAELDWWEPQLLEQGKTIEAARLHQRTMYDIEMFKELGYCHGIENYSRHLTGKQPGEPPPTLLDYLPRDAMVVVDESHQTIPQVRGMYNGDQSRKGTLVEYGFRLPSAKDNRPLNFEEWKQRVGQLIYVSATPGPYELTMTGGEVIEQVIRPTGLIDPEVDVRPVRGQIDDLLNEIRLRTERNERTLVTTLTKKMAEDLTDYYTEVGVQVRYLHSDVQTLDRIKILRDLRRGEFDVLVGINLLREGLDLPEVSLVAILDADKEGFLRSASSLIQTIGRAARNVNGRAILYADRMTDSMRHALGETSRRREKQAAYNREHGITPQTIVKAIDSTLVSITEADYFKVPIELDEIADYSLEKLGETIERLEREMRQAAAKYEFERAAELRDKVKELRKRQLEVR